MAKPLILKIRVDDKGNPVLEDLSTNLRRVGKTAVSTGKIMKGVFGAQVILGAVRAAASAMRGLVDEALKFQDVFKKIEAITGVAGKSLERLKDASIELANGSEFMASAVAAAQLQISKMGFTPLQTIEAMPKIMALATAGITNLAEAGEITVQALKSFELQAKDTQRVVDAIFVTISKTSIGFDDFKQALKFIGPIAKTMNQELEETFALIGVLGDVGLKGSVGGTALKNMLLNLLKPSKDVAREIKNLNFEGKGLAGALKTIKDRFGDDVLIKFMETFNLRALTGALAVSGLSEKTKELIDIMKTQIGITKRAAAVIRNSMISQLNILKSAIFNNSVELVRIFETMDSGGTPVKKLTKRFFELQQFIKDNAEGIKEMTAKFLEFADKTIDVIVTAVKFLARNIDNIRFALELAGQALIANFAISRITAILAGLKGLALAFTSMGTAARFAIGPLGLLLIAVELLAEAERRRANMLDRQNKVLLKNDEKTILKKIEALRDLRESLEAVEKVEARIAKGEGFRLTPTERGVFREFKSKAKQLSDRTGLPLQFFINLGTSAQLDKQIKGLVIQMARLDESGNEIVKAEKILEKSNKSLEDLLKRQANAVLKDIASREKGDKRREREAAKALREAEKLRREMEKANARPSKERKRRIRDFPEISGLFKGDIGVVDKLPLAKIDGEIKKVLNRLAQSRVKIERQKKALKNLIISSSLQFTSAAADATLNIISNALDARLELELKALDQRRRLLMIEKEATLKTFGDTKEKQALINSEFAKKEREIQRQKEQAEREAGRKRKALAITQSIINTAIGITSALATGFGPGRFIEAALVAALGAVQLGVIASQNFRNGTHLVGGRGGPTSDSNLANVSRGEAITSVDTISRLGGPAGFQQILDENLDSTSSSGGGSTIIFNVSGNLIGNRENIREIVNEIELENSRRFS